MRNLKFLALMFVLIAGMSLMSSCSKDGDDDNPGNGTTENGTSGSQSYTTQLVGTWVCDDEPSEITLKSDGTGTWIYYGETMSFKNWTLKSSGEISAYFTSGADAGKTCHIVTIADLSTVKSGYFYDRSCGHAFHKK